MKYNQLLQNLLSTLEKEGRREEVVIVPLSIGAFKLTFKFCPFGCGNVDDKKLPVISHFQLEFPEAYIPYTQTKFYSKFFFPQVLNAYDSIDQAATDAFYLMLKEKGGDALINKVKSLCQLSLF